MTIARSLFWIPVCAASLSSAHVLAAEVGSQVRASQAQGFTAEIKPLTTLLSTIPGVGAAAVGVEMETRNGIAPYLEAVALNSNLPERFDAKGKEEFDLYPNRLKGGQVDLGARVYVKPKVDSWYVGAKLGYAEVGGEWNYNDATVNHRMSSVMPGLGAGYRWIWDNNLVVRLGAGMTGNIVRSQKVSRKGNASQAEEAERKVKDRFDNTTLANVDLGLGYMF